MKKFIFMMVAVLITAATFGQSTTPRFGNSAGKDNTARIMQYKVITTADAAGADTVKLRPNAWTTIVRPSAALIPSDSIQYQIKDNTKSCTGDQIQFFFLAGAGTCKVKFVGTNWKTGSGTTTLSMTTGTRATITFLFDGVYWIEQSRTTGQ